MPDPRCISRLELRQYKSIEKCDVELGALTILVGRNAVGKSNILDALRFVSEALRNTLEYAVRIRGGIDQVRRKSLGGRPTRPGIAVEVLLPNSLTAEYSFRIADVQGRGFRVDRERCRIMDASRRTLHEFAIREGEVAAWTPVSPPPAVAPDRLYLVAASGLPEFRVVFDRLQRMTFHNLNPEVMKLPQRPEPGELLTHDGRNLASVVKQLQSSRDKPLERVVHFLRAIGVPISRIKHRQASALETIAVAQQQSVPEGARNAEFDAIALSDGTVRALGILVSIFSARGVDAGGPSLIGIEEPETALHPAAAGALMEALSEGAERTQLLITCHSPDFLDHPSVSCEMIRPVLFDNGCTRIGKLAAAKAKLLQDHLATAGELLRLDQLEPDSEDLARQEHAKGTLFEGIA